MATQPRGLLRFVTAGSVDDGKSTLIGRLLFETKGVYEDQLQSARVISSDGHEALDLARITDGLKAEREQAITIDVGYRYFSTSRRDFIIADAPGHEQFTRNMVTAASTANAAVLLLDAQKGVVSQTRRHAYLLWLLGVHHIIVVVNKMDLVRYEQESFIKIRTECLQCFAPLEHLQLTFIPMNALSGENVARPGSQMAWYGGPSLLRLLEDINADEVTLHGPFRMPIQSVIRTDGNFRGYAGRIESGQISVGQTVVAWPSRRHATINKILLYNRFLDTASQGQSVVVTLSNEIELGRGAVLAGPEAPPFVSWSLLVRLVWMGQSPLKINQPYQVKQGTRSVCAIVTHICEITDISTFQISPEPASLGENEIALVALSSHQELVFDPYSANRGTGSLILVDPATNDTVAAGMIVKSLSDPSNRALARANRQPASRGAKGVVVWLTGLSGSGKSTIAAAVRNELHLLGCQVEVLDGDEIRKSLTRDLGFSRKDRRENVRRIAFVARLLAEHGIIVLVAAISPYRADRDEVRARVQNFIEVHISAPLSVCEARDPKGLYAKARRNVIPHFTGIDDPYEPPVAPEIVCQTDTESLKGSTDKVLRAVAVFLSQTQTNLACELSTQ